MLGVDLTAIPTIGIETALTIASEVGPDLSRFPSAAHFCSCLTLAPGTRISGGKLLRESQPKRLNRAGQALRMAASTARHNKTYIGACQRARLRRLDAGRANKATAHQLARLVYAMLTRGEEYVAREVDDFEAERAATRAAPTELSCRASAQRTGRKRPGQVEAALPVLVGLLPGLGRDHFAQRVEIRIADEVQIFPGLFRHQR